MVGQSAGRPAWVGLVLLLGACEATSPERVTTLDLRLPGAVDMDAGTVDSVPGPGRGNEVHLYTRAGAPWVASVPGIQAAPRGNVAPSVATCRAATDWNYFESPVAAVPAVSYFCVKTSRDAVGWLKLEHFAGVTTAVRVTFEVAR
jgi:hypothetical protein